VGVVVVLNHGLSWASIGGPFVTIKKTIVTQKVSQLRKLGGLGMQDILDNLGFDSS
jgi:hypothetical protein